jgi:hypothetical protein
VTFGFAGRVYVYDRLGLRRAPRTANDEEEVTDGQG